MFEQLRRRDLLDIDYVVPIPLPPDKALRGTREQRAETAEVVATAGQIIVKEAVADGGSEGR